jgi:hypothetical protein
MMTILLILKQTYLISNFTVWIHVFCQPMPVELQQQSVNAWMMTILLIFSNISNFTIYMQIFCQPMPDEHVVGWHKYDKSSINI